MKIAILGWGSLYWDPRGLNFTGVWFHDGPPLPVEFARISSDNRLTLVIKPNFAEVQTLYAISKLKTLKAAIKNLMDREGTTNVNNIGYLLCSDNSNNVRASNAFMIPVLQRWNKTKKFDAIIWSDFAPRFSDVTGKKFNETNVLSFLENLNDDQRAKALEYIYKTPQQIQTKFRESIENRFPEGEQRANAAGNTSLLPQYYQSKLIEDRFIESALAQDELTRAKNKRGIKISDEEEVIKDNLQFFQTNKGMFEDEFHAGLTDILNSPKRVSLFLNTVILWCRGKYKSNEVQRLKRSIYKYYFDYSLAKSDNDLYVKEKLRPKVRKSFDDDEIEAILRLNREMMDGHLVTWLNAIDSKSYAMEKIYIRRGIGLKKKFTDLNSYVEKSFINAYSLAITIPEKFSQMRRETIPIILNQNYADVRSRIIFFTPFIQGCPYDQFEIGVIPHYTSMLLKDQGLHAGIQEYLVYPAAHFD